MKKTVLKFITLLSICTLAFLTISIGDVLALTVTFGQTDQSGATSNPLSTIQGSQYTTTMSGRAESISAYLSYTPTTGYFGQIAVPTIASPFWNIGNEMAGQAFTSPQSSVIAQSISGYFLGDNQPHKVKAAIYDSSGHFIVGSEEKSVAGTSANLQTFELAAPTLLSASTIYIIVAWSDADRNDCSLLYNSESSNGLNGPATYGAWPATKILASDSHHNFFIWCNYETTANVQCAIYTAGGASQVGVTEQQTLTSSAGNWVTFNFDTQPFLNSRTQYVLAAWSSDPNVKLYYTGTTASAMSGSGSYPNWPSSLDATSTHYNYNLYCSMSTNNFLLDFSYDPQPTHPGVSTTFTFKITNDPSSNKAIQFITIKVPQGFSEPTMVDILPPEGKNWAAETSATLIFLQKGQAQSNALQPGESLTITFTAIAQTPILNAQWTVHALQGDNEFTLIGSSQPIMSVIPISELPESPIGPLAAIIASLGAFAVYKKHSHHQQIKRQP